MRVTSISSCRVRFTLPSDGWYHLAKAGDSSYSLGLGGNDVTLRLNRGILFRLVAAFTVAKASPNFAPLLVGWDQESSDEPYPAAGWILDVQSREDGLWAQIDLNQGAKQNLVGGVYQKIRPVFEGKVVGGVFVPVALVKAEFTNRTMMKSLVRVTIPERKKNL